MNLSGTHEKGFAGGAPRNCASAVRHARFNFDGCDASSRYQDASKAVRCVSSQPYQCVIVSINIHVLRCLGTSLHLLCDPCSRSRRDLRSRRGHRHLHQLEVLSSLGLVKTTVRKHPNTDNTCSDAEVRHRRQISWHLRPNIKSG